MSKKFFLERTDPERAKEIIFNTLKSLLTHEIIGVETIEIQKARGRILAESIRANLPVPKEYLSAMDGVATKAEFTQGASPSHPVKIKRDFYLEINTGNVIPRGFDCVIRREDYHEDEDGIITIVPHQKYQNIRVPGEDVLPFDLILETGSVIDGKVIALSLQAGIKEVKVLKKIKAVFLPTGSELLSPDRPLESCKIYETNSYIFKDYLERLDLEVVVHEIVPDDPDLIRDTLISLTQDFHMIFVSGGTSAGEYDYTAEILKKEGNLLIHGLHMRPGKPFVFGVLKDRPVFGLPGYPGAGLFGFEYVLLPVLKDFLGHRNGEGKLRAFSGRKIAASEGEDHLFNVAVSRVQGKYWFYPIKQGSGPVSPFIERSGYIVIEKGIEGIDENVEREVLLSERLDLVERSILFAGSHDLSLDILKEILWKEERIPLKIVNMGSLGGILAILKSRAHLAGVHLLSEETGEYNIPFIKKYDLKVFYLFPFLKREQGFLVKKDTPEVKSFKEIAEKGLRFVSRQRGSGTRILTDYLLKKEGLTPDKINGYDTEVVTHIEVAHYVNEGLADVGVAIYPVAKLFDLKFLPISYEEYDLLLPKFFYDDPRFKKLVNYIKSPVFKKALENLGGYKLVFTESPKLEG